jgi:opine dehydrogenase
MRVAILGAGNGGLAAAADLTLRGHEVRLFEHPRFADRLAPIRERGGVQFSGIRCDFAAPFLVTEDLREAVRGADLIHIVTPAFGHRPMAELLVSHLAAAQPVLLNPGSTGGALEVAQILKPAGHRAPIGETSMLTYVCRAIAPGNVLLTHVPHMWHLAAFPASGTGQLLAVARELYPYLAPASDVIEIGLNNVNPVIHLGTALCNAGRIEATPGGFYFFRDGLTTSLARIHTAMDDERVALMRVFGYEAPTTLQYMEALGYTARSDDWYEAIHTSEVFCGPLAFRAPRSLQDRQD